MSGNTIKFGDVIAKALRERGINERANMPPAGVRFDTVREIYRDCRWCRGRGCLQCQAEAEKDYRATFPQGPQPVATLDLSKPEAAKSLFEKLLALDPK